MEGFGSCYELSVRYDTQPISVQGTVVPYVKNQSCYKTRFTMLSSYTYVGSPFPRTTFIFRLDSGFPVILNLTPPYPLQQRIVSMIPSFPSCKGSLTPGQGNTFPGLVSMVATCKSLTFRVFHTPLGLPSLFLLCLLVPRTYDTT